MEDTAWSALLASVPKDCPTWKLIEDGRVVVFSGKNRLGADKHIHYCNLFSAKDQRCYSLIRDRSRIQGHLRGAHWNPPNAVETLSKLTTAKVRKLHMQFMHM